MNTIDLTPLLQAVVSLAVTLITAKVIPWIAGKTTGEQRKNLSMLIRTLVFAAEQVYGSGCGSEKLLYVKEKLREHGYTVDIAAIEAAVHEMNEKQKNGKEEKNEYI